MEAKAILRTARISPQKARLVADQVRGLPAERAVNLLLAIIEQVDVPLQQTLEFSFMLRGSTAAPRRG